MEKKNRYTVVNKFGKEIYHSDGFGNFIKDTILAQILGAVILIVIASVVCGIASLFS